MARTGRLKPAAGVRDRRKRSLEGVTAGEQEPVIALMLRSDETTTAVSNGNWGKRSLFVPPQ